MGCSSCGGRVGHFGVGAYVKPGPAQTMTATGPVLSTPNATGGMHAQYMQGGQPVNVQGLGDLFNFTAGPGDWVTGVPNGYITVGVAAIVIMMMMK